MADTSINDAHLLSPRRLIVQLVGFVIGAALLIWCIKLAIGGGDWSKLRDANAGLLSLLLGCTCVSLFINGSTFWLTAQPVARLPFWDLQRLNLACNLLNYAPIRVGSLGPLDVRLGAASPCRLPNHPRPPATTIRRRLAPPHWSPSP